MAGVDSDADGGDVAPAGSLSVERGDGDDGGRAAREVVGSGPTVRPTPSGDQAPLEVLEGSWETLAQAPFEPRWSVPTAVGDALVVWGGSAVRGTDTAFLDDGAVFRDGRWEMLAAAPLEGRSGAAMAALDDRLVVWGGLGRTAMLDDGAVYDLADRRWRPLPPAPLSPRTEAGAVWTGEEVLVVGGRDNAGPLLDGAAYDPEADRWRRLPAVPAVGSVDAWGGTEVHWTGMAAVVRWTTAMGGVLLFRLDPDAGSWERLDAPSTPVTGGVSLVAGDDDLVAVTRRSDGRPHTVAVSTAGGWDEVAVPEVPRPRGTAPQSGAGIVDGRFYLLAGADALVLDLAERSWASLGGLPAGLRTDGLAVVDDADRLVLWSVAGAWAAVWRPTAAGPG